MTQEIIELAKKIATEASKVGPYRTWTHEYAMSLIMQLVDASAAKKQAEMQEQIETLYAMYKQACDQRDALMDQQSSMIAAMRGKLQ